MSEPTQSKPKPYAGLNDADRTLEHYRQIIEAQVREMEALKAKLRDLGKQG